MPNSPPRHNPGQPRRRDADRRPAHLRGYDHDWQKIRDERLRRNPWCQDCEAEDGRIEVEDLIVDHTIPVHVRPLLRLVIENTRTLCRRHHAIKTDRDIQRYGAAR
ncbi:MAG TPA: HNH endonuclease [Planctomycetaceae bacterium]|jgi:5-methylcytosine-specific restriction endonuclease McrA